MALTRTPRAAHSIAMTRVIMSSPAFGHAVGQPLGNGIRPVIELTWITVPRAAREHPRDHGLGQEKDRVQVELERVAVVGLGQRLRRRDHGLAGVVDEHVDAAAERGLGLAREAAHVVGAGQVGGQRDGPAARARARSPRTPRRCAS